MRYQLLTQRGVRPYLHWQNFWQTQRMVALSSGNVTVCSLTYAVLKWLAIQFHLVHIHTQGLMRFRYSNWKIKTDLICISGLYKSGVKLEKAALVNFLHMVVISTRLGKYISQCLVAVILNLTYSTVRG